MPTIDELSVSDAFSPLRQPDLTGRPVRRVLVTGAAGYVGASLVRGLLADGLRVRAIDSLARGDRGIRALFTNPEFEFLRGDVGRVEFAVRAVRDADAVIHLAGSGARGEAARRADAAATRLLAEVCRGAGVARLLHLSTCDVYGRAPRRVDESSPTRPASAAAASALELERIVLEAGRGGPHATVFRAPEIFGVDAHPCFERGFNRFVARAWAAGSLPAPSGLRCEHFVHVADVCAILRQALAARAETVSGQVFNVGSETLRFLPSERLALLAEALAVEAPVGAVGAAGPEISFAKSRRILGVRCRRSLRAGIAELLLTLRRGWQAEHRAAIPPGAARTAGGARAVGFAAAGDRFSRDAWASA